MRSLPTTPPTSSLSIAGVLGVDHEGPDQAIDFLCALSDLQPGALCFSTGTGEGIDPDIGGGVVIAGHGFTSVSSKLTVLRTDSPRLAFAKVADRCSKRNSALIASTAVVHPSAVVHPTAVVEEGAVVGPKCVLGPNVVIGAGTVLVSDITLEEGVIIAHNSVLGEHGFGFERDPATDEVFRIPHIGGVKVGRRTQVGSMVSIARGTFGDTTIGEYCQIDSLTIVAHNAQVGDRCTITGCVAVAGSVKLHDDVWVGPSSVIRDGLTIGAGAKVGMGAVVTKSVPAGAVVYGNPAKEPAGH